ncbi:MAG: hypothetical protein ICV62_11355 [Cyanobacteria bacterium Co-bin13]|nr:hypothetical protein [Cyanobacteria bacterium Co-bin13]
MKNDLHNIQSSNGSWIGTVLRSPAKLGVALALGAAALILPACEAPDQAAGGGAETEQPQLGQTQEQPDATAEQQAPADSPEQLVGQTVVVNGEVNQVYGPNAFSMQAEDTFATNEEVLVLVTGGETPALAEGETVQLTGEVQQFDAAAIQEQYGADLDQTLVSQLADEYEGRPVIIAPSIDQLASELPDNN